MTKVNLPASVVNVTGVGGFSVPLANGSNGVSWGLPGYVDICAEFAVSTAVADNGPLINTALATLGPLGLVAFISKPGVYPIMTPIVIGNGSTTAASTWSARLVGAGLPGGPNVTGANTGTVQTMLQWAGAATTTNMVQILGPMSGIEISNIRIDGGMTISAAPTYALSLISVVRGQFVNLELTNCTSGLQLTTQAGKPTGYVNVDSLFNRFINLHVQYIGKSGAKSYGVLFHSAGFAYGNSCYNEFDCLWITPSTSSYGGSTINYDLYFQGCDSNFIRNFTQDGSQGGTDLHYVTAWDYNQTNIWPAGNVLDKVDFAGGQHISYGTPSTAGTMGSNSILSISAVNGLNSNPQIPNVRWQNGTYNGTVALVSGTATVTSVKTTQAGSFIKLYSIATNGGTPGILTVSARSTGSFTVMSLQPGTTTTQTADVSLVYWEIINDSRY